jgi:hypothetical protein
MSKGLRSLLGAAAMTTVIVGATNAQDHGRGSGPIIFVNSQGLFYDSIVTADPLPPRGPFQELYVGVFGLTTEFGPGDPQYVGGRWWMDNDGNGEMNEGDWFFSCPLLAPGRTEPSP